MHGPAHSDIVRHRLGLGCARLGSVLGADKRDAERLVHEAYERGIRFFDTANIYGQGESEQILAAALRSRRKDVTIVTKAGQYFPAWMRLAKPFKRALQPWMRGSENTRRRISMVRKAALPQDFSDGFLCASTKASLRRLNTDYVDILLLHSPPDDVIAHGEAMRSLEKLRASGKAVKIGVSCKDIGSGLAALEDSRAEVIELPLWPATDLTERFLSRARRQAVLVIGRGLLRATLPSRGNDARMLARNLASSLARPEISRLLIGTTDITHLTEVLDAISGIEELACT